jgi:signal transduction histidine kinase
MITVGKIQNRFLIMVITLFGICFIGFLDYVTGSEWSLSIFYILPIAFLALYKGTEGRAVLITSVFASIIYYIADKYTGNYSNSIITIWNAFARFIMFSAIGLLLLYLKEKDKKLRQVNKELQELNEEKNRIIGIAAHDLRNPVGGIYALSEILIDKNSNNLAPKVLEIVCLIKVMSDNALGLLKNLLDVSTIESGKVDLKLERKNYVDFVKEQVSLNQILAEPKNITILLDSQSEDIQVNFDGHYLSEVINNLLSNAIKYSYKNSEIHIHISRMNERQVLTEVKDSGKGIVAEEQQGLFNYFRTTSTKPTVPGESSTGLGLAIAKKIVVLHQGEIGVKSVINQGSNFYFTLPLS